MKRVEELASGVLERDPRAIARAISLAEDRAAEAVPLLKALFPHTGRAFTIGITGAPGSGKSTLAERLASLYRERGELVGIIAVDPTSPFSGGAILGDRIRMQSRSLDPGTYIRSMATRGHLGGLSAAARDAILILDAAGYTTILVETVGIGQDEVDIARAADATLLVLVPGMGDDVQAMKAGVMEIADLFVINKADREGVERMEQELAAMLSISARPDGWTPPIVRTVATVGSGIDELGRAIAAYRNFLERSGRARREVESARQRLVELLRERLLDIVLGEKISDGELRGYAADIVARRRDPYSVVEEIIERAGLKREETEY